MNLHRVVTPLSLLEAGGPHTGKQHHNPMSVTNPRDLGALVSDITVNVKKPQHLDIKGVQYA